MTNEMILRIGIDFDNTIVDYRPIFLPCARALGLLDDAFLPSGKTAIRDRLRSQSGGEERWQQLQAHVYGVAIAGASPYAGFVRFLAEAKRRGAMVAIVSHKSRFAAASPGADLRRAARRWLIERNVIGADAIAGDDVFFEGTRAEKIARVAALGLTHFIEDLADVLGDPAFPAATRAIHFRESWDAVYDAVFA